MDIRPPTPRRARILKECIQSGKDPWSPNTGFRCSQVQGFHALGAKIQCP